MTMLGLVCLLSLDSSRQSWLLRRRQIHCLGKSSIGVLAILGGVWFLEPCERVLVQFFYLSLMEVLCEDVCR